QVGSAIVVDGVDTSNRVTRVEITGNLVFGKTTATRCYHVGFKNNVVVWSSGSGSALDCSAIDDLSIEENRFSITASVTGAINVGVASSTSCNRVTVANN